MRKIVATVGFAILALPTCAAAHGANPIPRAQIRLTTTAGYRVPDTELRAILSAQSSGSDPAALAAQVNRTVAWADARISSVHGMQWHAGGYATVRTGNKTAPWRVQETLVAESADPSALLPLLGTLQARLHLDGLEYTASPRQIRTANGRAGVIALHRFLAAAKRDCAALGFPGAARPVKVDLQAGSPPIPVRPYPVMMAAMREAPGPVAANPGVTHGTVTASGIADCR